MRGPLPPSLPMFKNAARSLRFVNGTDLGRRVGVLRAIELMPDIRLGEHWDDDYGRLLDGAAKKSRARGFVPSGYREQLQREILGDCSLISTFTCREKV